VSQQHVQLQQLLDKVVRVLDCGSSDGLQTNVESSLGTIIECVCFNLQSGIVFFRMIAAVI
jgi:hypothetical protein